MRIIFGMLLLLMFVFSAVSSAGARTQYWLQVGAWADAGSKGNMGVQAEIRTRLYSVHQPDLSDSFWVGDNLDNGAFIQFGYEIEPGSFCIKGEFISGKNVCTGGSDQLGSSDARWFWQYWPVGQGVDYYYASGPAASAGPDGTWHTYAIVPNVANSWDFVLDGHPVGYVSFTWTHSKGVAFVAAEKSTPSGNPGALGPVEFRNLAYLKSDGWHQVNSLYVLRGCGYRSLCIADIPYGVRLIGPNHIIAGTNETKITAGQLLWGILSLTVIAPANAHVLVDGIDRGAGLCTGGLYCSQLTLQAGWHQVSVDSLVQVDSKTRMRFSSWSAGSTGPSISEYMDYDLTLQASYVTQYLIVSNRGFGSTQQSWYDDGSMAVLLLSSGTVRPMLPLLGVIGGRWLFIGWYENSDLVTTSANASVLVDSPHTLEARWQSDYREPTLILAIVAITVSILSGAILTIMRRRQSA